MPPTSRLRQHHTFQRRQQIDGNDFRGLCGVFRGGVLADTPTFHAAVRKRQVPGCEQSSVRWRWHRAELRTAIAHAPVNTTFPVRTVLT